MGSQKLALLSITRIATAVILARQFVSPTGAVATAAGSALGVATQDVAASGDAFPCDVLGTTTVVASGAISDGDTLEVGANGAAIVKTAGVVVAVALEDAADGELLEVLLIAGG